MLLWLKKLFQKKNNCCDIKIEENTCESCVWWKAEEENNVPYVKTPHKRYCDIYKDYTNYQHSCALYKKERFEATADSIQTEELSLDLDLSIEGSQSNDPRGKR